MYGCRWVIFKYEILVGVWNVRYDGSAWERRPLPGGKQEMVSRVVTFSGEIRLAASPIFIAQVGKILVRQQF